MRVGHRIRGLHGKRKPAAKASGTLGPCLHVGVSFDIKAPRAAQWLVTEEYLSGYVIRSRHPSRAAAERALKGQRA